MHLDVTVNHATGTHTCCRWRHWGDGLDRRCRQQPIVYHRRYQPWRRLALRCGHWRPVLAEWCWPCFRRFRRRVFFAFAVQYCNDSCNAAFSVDSRRAVAATRW